MFDNLFPDGEYHEGVDYNRHGTYEALKFFWAIKTATGLDVMKDSPHMDNAAPLHPLRRQARRPQYAA